MWWGGAWTSVEAESTQKLSPGQQWRWRGCLDLGSAVGGVERMWAGVEDDADNLRCRVAGRGGWGNEQVGQGERKSRVLFWPR